MSRITGVGLDIIEIDRIHRSCVRFGDRFLERIYTPHERSYCFSKKNPYPSLAVRFAAKEAFAKAIRMGSQNTLAWTDVAVVSGPRGIPELKLAPFLEEQLRGFEVHLSLSHSHTFANAVVVIERKG